MKFLFLSFVFMASCAVAFRGQGTAYSAEYDMDATGENMCEFKAKTLPDTFQRYYAALSEADWKSNGMYDVCGRCIRACGTEKDAPGCVIAMVVDQCPDWACVRGNVDFSTVALEKATGYSWDRKSIEWDFVDCDSGVLSSGSVERISSEAVEALEAMDVMVQG